MTYELSALFNDAVNRRGCIALFLNEWGGAFWIYDSGKNELFREMSVTRLRGPSQIIHWRAYDRTWAAVPASAVVELLMFYVYLKFLLRSGRILPSRSCIR